MLNVMIIVEEIMLWFFGKIDIKFIKKKKKVIKYFYFFFIIMYIIGFLGILVFINFRFFIKMLGKKRF